MSCEVRHRGFWLISGTAAALAALLLLTSFAPVSLDWAGERLRLIDGGAAIVYYSYGCEWRELTRWPHVQVRYEAPWSRGFCWLRWHWLPYKGDVPFTSTQRIAYFPLYMLLAPLLVGAWLLRDRRQVPPGHCRCGYDLTGNASGRCPECGEEVANVAAKTARG